MPDSEAAYRLLALTPCSCYVLIVRMIEHGELSFKIVRLEPGGQEIIARAGNYEVCKAAFDKALFCVPDAAHRNAPRRTRDLQVQGGRNVGEIARRAPMSSNVRESYPEQRATALRHR